MNLTPEEQRIADHSPPVPYIWLNHGEREGVAGCGCRLYYHDGEAYDDPAFDFCPLHAAAPELLTLCHSLIESPLGEFHELSDTDKELMARLQPDTTAKDNPSRRTP